MSSISSENSNSKWVINVTSFLSGFLSLRVSFPRWYLCKCHPSSMCSWLQLGGMPANALLSPNVEQSGLVHWCPPLVFAKTGLVPPCLSELTTTARIPTIDSVANSCCSSSSGEPQPQCSLHLCTLLAGHTGLPRLLHMAWWPQPSRESLQRFSVDPPPPSLLLYCSWALLHVSGAANWIFSDFPFPQKEFCHLILHLSQDPEFWKSWVPFRISCSILSTASYSVSHLSSSAMESFLLVLSILWELP